jgi:hypothetical protein
MSVQYRMANADDAAALYQRLREADRRELELSSGPDVLLTLTRSVDASEVCMCAEDEEGIVCIWGIARTPEGGSVWMLGADSLQKYQRLLVSDTKPWVHQMLPHYGLLGNYVHAENTKSIRWLKMLGFTFLPEIPDYGVGKAPFLPFYLQDPSCVNQQP